MNLGARCLRDLLVLAAAVTLVAFGVAFAIFGSVLPSPSDVLRPFGAIVSGPLAGWFLAIQSGSILSALWSLAPLTLLALGPLVIAIRHPAHRIPWFVLAGAFWLAAGVFYGVVIWI